MQKAPRRTPNNDITEVDWDIMGTGLDIDLASQLSPSLMRNGASRSYRDSAPSSESSSLPASAQQASYQKLTNKEFTSLLISDDDDDVFEDQELSFPSNGTSLTGLNTRYSKPSQKLKKYPVNGGEMDEGEHSSDDDGLVSHLASRSASTNRLIDFP